MIEAVKDINPETTWQQVDRQWINSVGNIFACVDDLKRCDGIKDVQSACLAFLHTNTNYLQLLGNVKTKHMTKWFNVRLIVGKATKTLNMIEAVIICMCDPDLAQPKDLWFVSLQ